MTTSTVHLVSGLALYRHLSVAELEEVVAGLRPVVLADGEALMRQGDQPDGAYFITSGAARVLTRLPGGGETLIAEVGPGSMLGELALIRAAPRGATVRAQGRVEALFADRQYFAAALAQLRPVALKVARNLAAILAQRLQMQQQRIAAHIAAEPAAAYFGTVPAGPGGSGAPAFDVRAFLPLLPCLRGFAPADLDRLLARAEVLDVARGTRLDEAEGARAWVVVRGALMAYLPHDGGAHQLNIFGPGTFCGADRLVAHGALAVRHVAREQATLLALSAPAFAELFEGLDGSALRFVGAVNDNLAALITRGGNHLTRLVGIARLHRQREAVPAVAI